MSSLLASLGLGPDKYPTLGFDPAPGSPEEVSAFAAALRNAAAQLGDAKIEVNAVAGGIGGWEGRAAEGFRTRVYGFPKRLDQAAHAMNSAADVLERWERDLAALQAKAASCEKDAAEARKRLAAAENDPALSLVGQLVNALTPGAQAEADAAARRLRAAQQAYEDIVADATVLKGYHEELSGEAARKLAELAELATDPGLLRELLDDVSAPFEAAGNWMTRHANQIANLGDVAGDIAMGSGLLSLLSIGAGGVLVFTGVGTPVGAALITAGAGGLGASSLSGFGALGLHTVAASFGGDVSAKDLVFDVAGVAMVGVGKQLEPAIEGLDDVGRAVHEAIVDGPWQSGANSMQQEDIAQHGDDYWRDGWWNIPAAMEQAWSLGAEENSAAEQEAAERLREAKQAVAP
ncbi:putative T7SS-secreted protein [Micromonospora sp. NPDC049559]|uniref:putative T7SS-secreted protein n=1 Tax=Micromonospora sp. NPDC049559 TaxID=3155923 RepID=UPI0034239F30